MCLKKAKTKESKVFSLALKLETRIGDKFGDKTKPFIAKTEILGN